MVVSPGGSSPLVSLIEPLTPLFQPGRKIFQLTSKRRLCSNWPLQKREGDWSRKASRSRFWDRFQ